MLPFFNMRFFRNGNLTILQPFIDKMEKGELTLENILEEDEIVQDLKTNPNSKFIGMLTNKAIRQLIDYATKIPKSDDKNVGYKYPFNATEILCCENKSVIERIMTEKKKGETSEEEEDEKDEGEKEKSGGDNVDDEKNDEENEEFIEVKEEEENKEPIQEKQQEKEIKNEGEPEKQKIEQTQEKTSGEKPENEVTSEEDNKEVKTEQVKKENEKQESENINVDKKEESKPEEVKKDEQNVEPEQSQKEEKPEEAQKEEGDVSKKSDEPKQQAEEIKNDEKKLETKNEEINKPEETPKEESKKEQEQNESEQKNVEIQEKENKEEKEEKKEEAEKTEEKKEEEKKEPKLEEDQPPVSTSEKEKEQKPEEDESQKKEEENTEEPKQEDNDNQKNEEEKEEEQEKEDEEPQKDGTVIYDNVDYLLKFLDESEETKSNYVLVGYFYKILNHLINSQSTTLIQYLFDYPKKNEFDVLGLIIKNMKRKSMGELVNKLLLFQDSSYIEDFLPKKFELLEKILEELKETNEEDKFECICSTLESVFYNKNFFIEFMKETKFLDSLYDILEKSLENPKKLSAVLRLLINVHENILKNEDERITISVTQENPMDFLSMLNGAYGLEETNQKEVNPELQKFVDDANKNLISLLKKCNFNFINDLDDFSSKENSEFMSTYQIPQKKLGMKKLLQIEFFRSILDILVNAYSKFDEQEIKDSIINIINSAQEKKIFWKMHKLFFDFPFCNLYQSFYLQIFDIILNQYSPKELIDYTFIEKDGENEKNLIQIFIDKVINEMQFKFSSERISFHPNYSFEVSILNKIIASTNEYVKEFIKDNKNLAAFDQILGKEIDTIFNQKLLLDAEKDIQIGPNIGIEKEETPLQYFGKKNFMELLEQDNSIYSVYLKGEDYETLLNEKKEQEKKEKEERQKLEEKKIEEGGDEEEMVAGLGDSINILDDNNAVEHDEIQKMEEEEEEKDRPDTGTEEEGSEETEDDKRFNDVNYWKADVRPDDNIMSAVLNDLD